MTIVHTSAGCKETLRVAGERIAPLDEARGQPERATGRKAGLGLSDLPDDVFARP
jgi:hypothetical protein